MHLPTLFRVSVTPPKARRSKVCHKRKSFPRPHNRICFESLEGRWMLSSYYADLLGLPAGFDAELFAQGVTDYPLMDFDSAGNLYLSDNDGPGIARISPDGTVGYSNTISDPDGVAVDSQDRVLVGGGDRVTEVHSFDGGSDIVLYSGFGNLDSIAVDSADNIVVLDGEHKVLKIDRSTGDRQLLYTVAGYTGDVAFNAADDLFIAGNTPGQLIKIDSSGHAEQIGTLDRGYLGFALAPGGAFGTDLYVTGVSDSSGQLATHVLRIDDTSVITTFASPQAGIGGTLAFSPSGDLYAAEYLPGGRVFRVFATSPIVFWDGEAGDGLWQNPVNWSNDTLPSPTDDAIIDVPGDITVTLSSGEQGVRSLTCQETLVISGGSLDITAPSVLTSLSLQNATLSGSGDLTITERLDWNLGTIGGTGTVVLATGAEAVIGAYSYIGAAPHILDGRTLEIEAGATVAWEGHGSSVQLNHGAAIQNYGTFYAHASIVQDMVTSAGETGAFYNYGELIAQATTNSRVFVPFYNYGSVLLEEGTILHIGGGSHTGQFIGRADSTLSILQSSFAAASSVSSEGEVGLYGGTMAGTYDVTGSTRVAGDVDFSGSVLNVGQSLWVSAAADFHDTAITTEDLTLAGNAILSSGDLTITERLDWNLGTIGGTGTVVLATGAEAVIGAYSYIGAAPHILDGRTLEIEAGATVAWEGHGSSVQLNHGAAIQNYGTFYAHASIVQDMVTSAGETGAFYNYGELIAQATTNSRVFVPFYNYGTVDVQGGRLGFNGGYTQTNGETRLNGGSISSSSPLDIQDGLLTGSGPIYGSVINRGRIVPGLSSDGIGMIQISGDYIQPAVAEAGGPYEVIEGENVQLAGTVSESRGALDIEIGGLEAAQFDQLQVSDSVKLGGTLNVSLVNGFLPNVDDTVIIVENDGTYSVVGVFAGLDEGAVFAVGGAKFRITYQGGTGNDVVLIAVDPATPEQGGSTLGYEWDLDGDGIFGETGNEAERGDEVGPTPVFSAADLIGPTEVIVALRLTDATGLAEQDEATIYVLKSPAPEAAISGPNIGVRGQHLQFVLTASDSPADEAAGFSFNIDWGDGTVQTIDPTSGNGDGTAVDHAYKGIGTYTVTMTATDQAGLVSDPVEHVVDVAVVAEVPSVCDPSKTSLAVGGTLDDDHIVFHPGDAEGEVVVLLNGVTQGSYYPTGQLLAYGQAGNDTIQVSGSLAFSAWLDGGEGDDRLKAGAGHDVLLGGIGNDLLVGGAGRDLLIGGVGADRIVGNPDDDILIAGNTLFDTNDLALCAIMREWTSDRDYGTRVDNLRGSGSGDRLNAEIFFKTEGPEATVFDDEARDLLTGSQGLDWFIFRTPDLGGK